MRTIFFTAPRWTTPVIRSIEDLADSSVLDGHNLTPEVLADLDFIVTGETDREPAWLSGDEAAVGVMRLSQELVTALADLRNDRLVEISDEWGATGSHGDASYLRHVRDIANESLARDEDLFVTVYY